MLYSNRHCGIVVAMCLVMLIAFSGCTTTNAEVSGKKDWDQDGAPGLQYKNRVDTSAMSGDIEVLSAQRQQFGDMMRAQVSIRSKTSSTLKLQYKFDWLDGEGAEINANKGAWIPLIIYAHDTTLLQGVAPDPRGKEFKLKLRKMDE
ncbi:MAG: DUF1425 domain-containing protein [Deltaproteobacteria bacterium]